MRNAFTSEVRTQRETVQDQKQKTSRTTKKLKQYATRLRRQDRDNEKARSDLRNREKDVLN